jgi:hypothetical protein
MGTKLILAVVIAALAAGSAAAKPSRTVAVGKVRGTEVLLAVTYDGHRLRAYACNGSARRLPTISSWFEAAWDGRGPITVVSGGVELRMESATEGALDGHRFALEPATGPAGLYERTSGTTVATSVVLPSGEIRGAMIPLRPPRKCVAVTTSSGGTVIVCG